MAFDFVALLASIPDKIPNWLGPAAEQAVELAETVGKAKGLKGKKKRDLAVSYLKGIARVVDIPSIPEFIETPLEDAAITIAVQLAWSTKLKGKGKKDGVEHHVSAPGARKAGH